MEKFKITLYRAISPAERRPYEQSKHPERFQMIDGKWTPNLIVVGDVANDEYSNIQLSGNNDENKMVGFDGEAKHAREWAKTEGIKLETKTIELDFDEFMGKPTP